MTREAYKATSAGPKDRITPAVQDFAGQASNKCREPALAAVMQPREAMTLTALAAARKACGAWKLPARKFRTASAGQRHRRGRPLLAHMMQHMAHGHVHLGVPCSWPALHIHDSKSGLARHICLWVYARPSSTCPLLQVVHAGALTFECACLLINKLSSKRHHVCLQFCS